MSSIKRIVKRVLPAPALTALRNYRIRRAWSPFEKLTPQQVFTRIYEEGLWGKSANPSDRFYSGTGSRRADIVETYVEAVRGFLASFERKPDVVDLGCGDFFVGSRIRALCGSYTGCDVVEPLIAFNTERYRDLEVNFRVIDLTADELPRADVVFIRQVLQHLSNDQIRRALPQISSKYKYLVLTEHVPDSDSFEHNLDKPAGPDSRLAIASGVVLTSPPFNLHVQEQRQLCEAWEDDGFIRTHVYKLG